MLLRRRLVTVSGRSGVGKTALALAAAHYVSERACFRDSVVFVPLQGVRDLDASAPPFRRW